MKLAQIATLLPEIRATIKGLPLTHFQAEGSATFVLTFGSGPLPARLLIGLDRPFVRIYLLSRKVKLQDHPFAHRLEKKLLGWSVTDLGLLNEDRIVVLHLEHQEHKRRLLAELFSMRPRLYLLDADDTIQESWPGESKTRYQLPPKTTKQPLLEALPTLTSKEFQQDIEQRIDAYQFEQAKQRAVSDLQRRRKQTQRRILKLQEQRKEAKQWPILFHEATLLQANFHLLRKGLQQVEVIDWEAGNISRTIDLPVDKSPKEIVADRFAKSRRFKRSIVHLDEQLGQKHQQLQAIDQQIAAVQQATTIDQLPAPSVRPKPRVSDKKELYRTFYTRSGLMILVGRSAKDNDFLTFRVAKGSDWWLHVRDLPGAHVVLRVPKGQRPDDDALCDALQVALHYSNAKREGEADILVTQRKFLSKPKNGKPGQVNVSKHTTRSVREDNERWKRLAARK